MGTRLVAAKVLFLVAIPFVFFGLIDPLEGGLSLIMASALYLLAFVLDKSFPPRSLWIPFTVAVAIGFATIVYSIVGRDPNAQGLRPEILIGMWSYRLAVAVTIAGAMLLAYRKLFQKK